MKFKVAIILLILLVLTLSTSTFAGNSRRIGSAGAQELLIPIGARGSAMGGALTANTTGIESVFWNPAGLSSIENAEIMFTHLNYFADIDVNFLSVGHTFEEFGTLAFSWKGVAIGDIEETTEGDPEGTGAFFNPTFTVIGISYAKVLTANVNFGGTINYLNEKISDVQASGLSFDAGFTYDPRWNGLTFGIAFKNWGPTMKFDGPGFDRTYEAAGQRVVRANSTGFEIPNFIKFGFAYNFVNDEMNSATFVGNFASNNFSEDMYQGGFEYTYDGKFSVRGGYNYSNQDDFIYGLSFGGGYTHLVGDTKLTFDYSWSETEFFDGLHYFTGKITF